MDEDNDGYLTRGAWRFFRSFLCVLVAMSMLFGVNSAELNTLLDDVSVQVTSEILQRNKVTKISFDTYRLVWTSGLWIAPGLSCWT